LIDKYLISEGINPKIAPVKLLSDDFPKTLNDFNKTGKAKASEMEHAIRWHIKVNMEKDPALYTGFYKRLQKILDSYKEHWDRIIEELTKLREDIGEGRTDEAGIVDSPVMPFLDLMLMEARITMNSKEIIAVAKLSELIYARIKESFSIPNFWQKPNERRRLEGDIRDELEYCGIEPLQEVAAKLTADLINLAHKREAEVKGS